MKLELVPAASRPMPAGHGDHQHHVKDQAAAAAAKKPAVVLAIRATAVLDTGRRQVAYRQRSDGAYELVELTLGARAEGKDDAGQSAAYFPVSKGLQDGDRVVARGGFLLDSQQQISGMPSLLYPQGQSASNLHSAHGGAGPTPAMNPAHKH
jgi:Cu(I)/Ag(I) efflux system membrane fusion protein